MRSEDVYVVGAGMHPFGRHEGVSGLDMAEHALRAALDDAGVSWADVDFAVGGSNVSGKPDSLVSRLGLTGVPFTTVKNGCATGGVALATSVSALQSRRADLVAVVGFDKHERGAFAADPSQVVAAAALEHSPGLALGVHGMEIAPVQGVEQVLHVTRPPRARPLLRRSQCGRCVEGGQVVVLHA